MNPMEKRSQPGNLIGDGFPRQLIQAEAGLSDSDQAKISGVPSPNNATRQHSGSDWRNQTGPLCCVAG